MRILGTLHDDVVISNHTSLNILRMRNVSDKSCTENKTHFMFDFFPKIMRFIR
jgi:hypothetical protein